MAEQDISIFPEQPVVYATFGQRLGAMLLDWLVLIVPSWLIARYVGGQNIFREVIHGEFLVTSITGQFASMILNWLYYALMESGRNQATIGKRAVGIVVTDMQGARLTFANATGRYFGKIISALIIYIGYFMMLWDDKNQTLHDKMAGTLVIKKPLVLNPMGTF